MSQLSQENLVGDLDVDLQPYNGVTEIKGRLLRDAIWIYAGVIKLDHAF